MAGLVPAIHVFTVRQKTWMPGARPSKTLYMHLRPALLSDCAAIARIYAPAVTHGTTSFELEAPDEGEMARRMRMLTEGGYPYLVAEQAGAIVGYAYAGPYRARPAYRFTVENSVYVAPGLHRRGVGRALLLALIDACTERGYRQMLAVIGDSPHQQGSVGLHQACGFTVVGRLPDVGFKFGRWLDSLLLQRSLGRGGELPP
jgi:L-amino acid N-acyltransferase YncA